MVDSLHGLFMSDIEYVLKKRVVVLRVYTDKEDPDQPLLTQTGQDLHDLPILDKFVVLFGDFYTS